MPTFIKRPTVTEERVDAKTKEKYEVSRLSNYKRSELVELYKTAHHLFIEVPESHANAVLRRQQAYQEVYDDVIAEATEVVKDTRPASPPVSKAEGRRRKAQSKPAQPTEGES